MHLRIKMSYLEPILMHPVRRQNFGDAVAQTCNPHLIPCHMRRNRHGKHAIPNKGSTWERFLRGPESEHRWALLRHLLTSLCQLFLTILCQHFWRFCVNIFDDSIFAGKKVEGTECYERAILPEKALREKLETTIENDLSKTTLILF